MKAASIPIKNLDRIANGRTRKLLSGVREIDTALHLQNAVAPRIMTLIGGQEDESPTGTTATISADTVNFKLGTQGWKMTMAGAVTGQLRLDPVGAEDPVHFGPAQAVGIWFYVPDATKITSVGISIASNSAATVTADYTWNTGIVTGWNFRRIQASAMTLTDWGTAYRVRVIVVTNAATDITVGHLYVECPQKAKVLIISDSAYKSFHDIAYPDLKQRGIPVTFALDPTVLGSNVGSISERITEAQVLTVSAENQNEIGFHGYDGTETSAMTAAQIRADTMKAIKWLESRGYYSGRIWRSAWVQNAATNHAAIQNLVLMYATPSSAASLVCWPVADRWNISRLSLHGRTQANMDTWFSQLQQTHQLLVCYNHGIDDGGGTNTTNAMWDYFIGKIDAGLAGGWLEGVTMEMLLARSGLKYRQTLGDTAVELYDETGVNAPRRLP